MLYLKPWERLEIWDIVHLYLTDIEFNDDGSYADPTIIVFDEQFILDAVINKLQELKTFDIKFDMKELLFLRSSLLRVKFNKDYKNELSNFGVVVRYLNCLRYLKKINTAMMIEFNVEFSSSAAIDIGHHMNLGMNLPSGKCTVKEFLLKNGFYQECMVAVLGKHETY